MSFSIGRALLFILCLLLVSSRGYSEPLPVGSKFMMGSTHRLQKVQGLAHFAQQFDQMFIFGDSLSDIGAVSTKSGGAFPPEPFYWGGRFTNGPTWNDYFAESVRVPMMSFAHAGARIVGQNNFYVLPSFLKKMWVDPVSAQVDELKKVRTSLGPHDLIVLWVGGNDYLLFPGHKSLDENLAGIKSLILSLQEIGAQNFIVLNVPDVSRSPFHGLGIGRALMEPSGINLWVKAHNESLETMIQNLKQESPQAHLVTVDMHTAFTEILDHPSDFGFAEIDYPCVGGQLMPGGLPFQPFDFSRLPRFICQNPEQTFFWDPWHPTTHAHCLAAASLLGSLANQGWVKGYDMDQGLSACQ